MAETSSLCFEQLATKLQSITDPVTLHQAITNLPFIRTVEMAHLFLGFITLMLVDQEGNQLELISYSDTEQYRMSVANYPFDPASFKIALDDTHNDFIKAMHSAKPVHLSSWTNIQRPEAQNNTTEFNQANSGITHYAIYPLSGRQPGTLMYNFYDFDRDAELKLAQLKFMEHYTAIASALL